MILRVVFHEENISWSKNWVFLGSSFKNLKNAENKIDGKRIKINDYLHAIFKNELKVYLEWTENQRKLYKDSTHWWMTSLAGRNNLSSNFLLYICQIKSLQQILKNFKQDEILIVSDDILLVKAILENLKDYSIKKNNFFNFKKIKNSIFYNYRFIRNLITTFYDIALTLICAKITQKEKKIPSDDVYLLHQHLDFNSLIKNEKIQSRYFPNLKEYFKKENLKLYTLTWYSFFLRGKIKAFKNLRKENCLIPEDWINLFDYIVIIKKYFKTCYFFKDNKNYPDFNINSLLLIEKRNHLEQINSNLRFWTYAPAIKKWTKNCNKITTIDHYENMIYEHALTDAVRNLNINKKVYGYHHTLSSSEFTAWHSLKSEWESNLKPDNVISLGPISRKFLENQGVPNKRIVDGPALRYAKILHKEKNENLKNKKNILVPLSQIRDASYEMLSSILDLSRSFQGADYSFIIKPHPNLGILKILESFNLKELPKNFIISNEDIDKLMDKSLFTIFMSTAAAYNAIFNGNIVFNLQSELNLSDNYLDFIEKDFKFVNSHSLESIKTTLNEFCNNEKKIVEYREEFEKIRHNFVNGFNSINAVNLAKFKYN